MDIHHTQNTQIFKLVCEQNYSSVPLLHIFN